MNVNVNKEEFVKQQRALMTDKLRKKILERDNYTCVSCGNSVANEPSLLLEVDHIIPVSKGGLTKEDNLQTLCWKCNRAKGSKLNEETLAESQTPAYAKSLNNFLDIKNKKSKVVELKNNIEILSNQLLEFSDIEKNEIEEVIEYWVGRTTYETGLGVQHIDKLIGIIDTLEYYYDNQKEEIEKRKEIQARIAEEKERRHKENLIKEEEKETNKQQVLGVNAKYVFLKHPNGKAKVVKKGYAWEMIFFGFFVPLFRGDFKWFLLLYLTYAILTGNYSTAVATNVEPDFFRALLTCVVWFGFPFKYNELYLKGLLKKGWYITGYKI